MGAGTSRHITGARRSSSSSTFRIRWRRSNSHGERASATRIAIRRLPSSAMLSPVSSRGLCATAGAVLSSGALVLGSWASSSEARAASKACGTQPRHVSRVADGVGPVVGTGSVRVAMGRNGVVTGRALEPPLEEWSASKVLWVVREQMGHVEIQGRRRGSNALVQWNDGRDVRSYASTSDLMALTTSLQRTPSQLGGSEWADLPSGPIFPASGCYVFTIRGEISTDTVTLRAS